MPEPVQLPEIIPPRPVAILDAGRRIDVETWRPTRKARTHGRRIFTVADFETTTTADDCRVWSWGIVQIPDDWQSLTVDAVEVGTSLDDFIDRVHDSNT